ncbi:hypothetical protein [Nocardia nova]|uniref:hypothetical protein n=1 Tax=Nocardia nova TaxID=37330 RepID=UPI00189371EF|nr:hypothetical protein [Nocardia nova]MBF6150245.1 hypothetical protein [Nocardia nova]MDN2496822.1 hypothetical protein [Nocardia nova]
MNTLAPSPLFSILMLLASSSALSAAVTAWFKRGDVDATTTKKKADAAKVLSDLAISETQRMSEQMGQFRMALRAHREWDRKMVARARRAGIEIDDPPELYL